MWFEPRNLSGRLLNMPRLWIVQMRITPETLISDQPTTKITRGCHNKVASFVSPILLR
jgi:hypothetical protein